MNCWMWTREVDHLEPTTSCGLAPLAHLARIDTRTTPRWSRIGAARETTVRTDGFYIGQSWCSIRPIISTNALSLALFHYHQASSRCILLSYRTRSTWSTFVPLLLCHISHKSLSWEGMHKPMVPRLRTLFQSGRFSMLADDTQTSR